uniref:Ubiquitinyl hydrolase 1 n=1 Tax=Syphacia muris TaxID=451379 RepID=A0A0N5AZA9_9BILA
MRWNMVAAAGMGNSWNVKMRISKHYDRKKPIFRQCRLNVDDKKNELRFVFESTSIPDQHFSFSSIQRFPKIAPKRMSVAFGIKSKNSEAQEILCEFQLLNHMLDFFTLMRRLISEGNQSSNTVIVRTRGVIQHKTTDLRSSSQSRSESSHTGTSTKKAKEDAGWENVKTMKSVLCSSPRKSYASPIVCKLEKEPLSPERTLDNYLTSDSECLLAGKEHQKPKKLRNENDVNENISPYFVYDDDFFNRRNILNETTPQRVKQRRSSPTILKEISVQASFDFFYRVAGLIGGFLFFVSTLCSLNIAIFKVVLLEDNVSEELPSLHQSGSARRRIYDMDDALLCQSPSKTPVSSRSSYYFSPSKELSNIRGGFENLGNTCYMNAILQSVCGVDEFSKELYRITSHIKNLHLVQLNEVPLMSAISELASRRLKASREEKIFLLQKIKCAVKNDAMRFSGYHQEDESDNVLKKIAHMDEVLVNKFSNPVTSNFSFTLRHEIKCESCGNIANRLEDGNDLPMHLPLEDMNKWNFDGGFLYSVQTLLDDSLRAEKVDFRCEKCGSSTSEISHKFQKLPRCIIVYFKRYTYDAVIAQGAKRKDKVEIPLFLTLQGHCLGETLQYASKISFVQASPSDSISSCQSLKRPAAKRRLSRQYSFEDVQEDGDFEHELNYTYDLADDSFMSYYGEQISAEKENEATDRNAMGSEREVVSCSGSRNYTYDELSFTSEEERIFADVEQNIINDDSTVPETVSYDDYRPQAKIPRTTSVLDDCDTSSSEMIDLNGNLDVDKPDDMSTYDFKDSLTVSGEGSVYTDEPIVHNKDLGGCGDYFSLNNSSATNSPISSIISSGPSPTYSKDERPNDDIEIFSQGAKNIYHGIRSLIYKPVDRKWRECTCEKLGLKISEEANDVLEKKAVEFEISILDGPSKYSMVEADGNCLFRALAYCITGGREEEHGKLRQKIVEFEKEFASVFKAVKGFTQDEWEHHLKQIAEDGFWGSDVEISVCATMLQVEIWTYLDGLWLCYRPRFFLDQQNHLAEISSKAYQFGKCFGLYLWNKNFHYIPVLEVSNANFLLNKNRAERISQIVENAEKGELKPSYRLLSVISHLGGTSESGHYVCDVWSRSGKRWLHCDDDSVSEVTEDSVRENRTSTGYIFFYIASDLLSQGDEA